MLGKGRHQSVLLEHSLFDAVPIPGDISHTLFSCLYFLAYFFSSSGVPFNERVISPIPLMDSL